MPNKKPYKYPVTLHLKKIIGAIILLVTMISAWLGEKFYTVRFPGGENPVELYSTEAQDDLTLIMSKAIDEAKQSVTLVIYNLTDPTIIHSLKAKSESEVAVKVICEAKNSPKIESRLGPKVKILKRFLGDDIMHIKLLIIDNKQTWIGSANMTRESLRHYGNLVAAIDSEPLAEMASAKARSFTSTERLQMLPHRTFVIGPQNVELWFLPDDPRAISRIKDLIKSAQKSIRIAMFAWSRKDLAYEVIAAKRRGVNVEIVLDKNYATGAGKIVTEMLFHAGVNIKLNRGPELLHHKFMIVDTTTLVNGSANWTRKAFETNDDCFIVVYPLQEPQKDLLEKTWQVLSNETMVVPAASFNDFGSPNSFASVLRESLNYRETCKIQKPTSMNFASLSVLP